MPGYVHRNENYRAELLTVNYPFSERSPLETDEVFIGTDVFIDAVIYLKEAAELPLHISSIDGTQSDLAAAVINLSDDTGQLKATCELVSGVEEHSVYSTEGSIAGVIVTNPAGLTRMLGRVAGGLFDLLQSTAEFMPDVTFINTVRNLRNVRVNERYVAEGNPQQASQQEISIVAGHGVKFTLDDEVLRLHLLGDAEAVLQNGLRSINGVSSPSLWLATHPRSNLRLSSENGQLNFIAGRDAT